VDTFHAVWTRAAQYDPAGGPGPGLDHEPGTIPRDRPPALRAAKETHGASFFG
jgi:hypothetical protein